MVVGGGISGLVTAYRLLQTSNGTPLDITVVEAARTLGGKLRTGELAGIPIEEGADSFVIRKPWAIDLCRELGLGDQLVAPVQGGALVWVRGRLVPYPPLAAFGIPSSVEDLLRWPGLSRRGRWRAATDRLRGAPRDAAAPRPRVGMPGCVARTDPATGSWPRVGAGSRSRRRRAGRPGGSRSGR